jgi:uncharacterized membrane protein YfcA
MTEILSQLSLTELLLAVGAAVLGSLVSGLSGMGGGVLMAIAVTPVVGIHALVPTIAVTMLVNHMARVWAFRSHVHWRPALLILAAATPFAVLGSLLYVSLPAHTVAMVMGVFLVVFVPLRRRLSRGAWTLGEPGLAGVGAVFGFISGTTIGAGAIIVPALLGTGLAGSALIATDAVIGLMVLVAKTMTFAAQDFLDVRLVAIGLTLGMCSVPGVYAARWIIQRTSIRVHTLFIEALIVAAGLSFIHRGLEDI